MLNRNSLVVLFVLSLTGCPPLDKSDTGVDCPDEDGDGYFVCQDDCNDTNFAVNPGAPEICDNVDNNCNGFVDTEDLTLSMRSGAEFYYLDADGDGYGYEGVEYASCEPPSSDYVEDATDCNDTNFAVNPGAPEICNDIDDDCDGSVDEDQVCGPD